MLNCKRKGDDMAKAKTKPKAATKPNGRPSKYETHIKPHLNTIAILRQNGMTNEYIANLLKVSRATYYNHLKDIDEFLDTIKNANKEHYYSALNHALEIVKGKAWVYKERPTLNGKGEVVWMPVERKTVIPSDALMLSILVNFSDGEFKHRQEVKSDDGNDDVDIPFVERLKNEADSKE